MRFDAYLMVDFSGASKPRRGANSIWVSLHAWSSRGLVLESVSNPPTRAAAVREIAAVLSRRRPVLAGFDFPFGFPAGFGARLGLAAPFWRSIWDHLAAEVRDADDNRNNRFEVAARLNSALRFPAFWGWDVSKGAPPAGLTAKKPVTTAERPIPEFRLVDRRIRGPKSIFQLWGNGSVGSQALLGIPRLHELLTGGVDVAVWPFMLLPAHGSVFVEVYPSMLPVTPLPGEYKDEAQVKALGQHFAEADRDGTLAQLFEAAAGPGVAEEEGWIFGVG